ncbi:virulence factor MviN [Spiractinospora alimapuensis]|uniref:murein biosynthesis integral membrane protein MurJ n=2 Tax=Spiractinospora alimapuensis TaxID=2820884 RepID=UPI001F31AFC9|nr:lipid II flippase MurJ [Spiractinospora alimapuensis]QVQ52117.1 virulence factor MviN [Spiractinospora alimapuensis]
MTRRRLAAITGGVAGAAALIAVVTAAARVAGFGRVVVFSQTVGDTCLGTAYLTANQIPTILFEVVVGGAVAGMVVPILAGPVRRGDTEAVRRISAAVVTWVLLVSTGLAVLLALVSAPLVALLIGDIDGCGGLGEVVLPLTARFLLMFTPQIVFYGLAAALYAVLQAHRRFLGPALAPLLSSLVVMGVYVAFVPLGGGYVNDLAHLPLSAELTLALGTTAGVVALFLTALAPALRLRVGLFRPTLRFPPGVAARAGALAFAALLPPAGMQLTQLLAIALANRGGGPGALALYNYAWALFTLPYGVVAIPIALSAFTTLSEHHDLGDTTAYRRLVAGAARSVLVTAAAAAVALAAAARPLGGFLAHDQGTAGAELTWAIITFAPGIVVFGLVALYSRALYAAHHGRQAAVAQLAGWAIVMTTAVALVAAVPSTWAVAALGAATSLGLGVACVALMVSVVRLRGSECLRGMIRSAVAVLVATPPAFACGAFVAGELLRPGAAAQAGAAVLAGVVAILVFALVTALVDRDAGRFALRAVLRRATP